MGEERKGRGTHHRARGRRRLDPSLASSPSSQALPSSRSAHRWLDTWLGIGLMIVGMHRQDWDLQMTEDDGCHWSTTFYVTGQVHSRQALDQRGGV